MPRKLAFAVWMLILVVMAAAPGYGADCRQSLFNKPDGVFAHEGGWQNSKYDTGNFITLKSGKKINCGGTKYGISCRDNQWLLKKFGVTDIRNLTQDQATYKYENNECAELKFTELKGQRIPTKMLDLAVNMGTGTCIKLIIKTINRLNGDMIDLPIKPVMTEEVIDWYNHYTFDPEQRSIFFLTMILEALDRYSDICEANPGQAKWLLGWIIRLNPMSD